MGHVQQTPLSGDLKQYMMAEVFLKAVLNQFSGTLNIENQQLIKLIYFKNGNVVFVESNEREETFGHFLLRQKKLDAKSLNAALQELSDSKDLKLGEILLKQGLIDPNTLMESLNLHQEEKLFNVFSIRGGTFSLIPNMEWPEYVTTFPLRTLSVFFSAMEKSTTLEEISDYTSIYPQVRVQLNHLPSRDLPLPPFATRLLNTLNREYITVEDLAKKLSMSMEKIITFLFVFRLADWIGVERTNETRDKVVEDSKATLPPETEVRQQNTDDPNEQIVEKKDINPAHLQQMQIDHGKLSVMNFYQIFGLNLEFTLQQIQIRFFQVISEYKKYEDHALGKEMVMWIKTAYDVLKDPKLRSMYDRRFAFRKKTENIEKGERVFYRALRMIEKNDLENAKTLLDGINKKAADSSFRAYQAFVLFRLNAKGNSSDVKKMIDEAFAIYPADPFAHYIAGQICQHYKDFKKSEHHYRAALQVFPGYSDAIAALESTKFEVTKEKILEKKAKEEEKNKKPGFFDLSVGGINFGGKKD